MFNKFAPAILAASVAALASPAFSGGFIAPVTETPVVPPVAAPAPVSDWSGAYAGLSAGYVFGSDDRVGISDSTDTLLTSPDSVDISGATYGLHAGYRWQREVSGRQVVFGPELAFEGSSADDSFTTNGTEASNEMKKLLSLRFKTGVLNAAQNTLFYGSVGISRGEFDYQVDGAPFAPMDYSDTFRANAWSVGLGVERKVTERMSVFGEWEYRDFGKTTLTDAAGYHTEATPEHHSLKLGVNFSF